ncbi:hypothetical protein EU546_01915 [Candidatus Thorarchaeota archaeon]|nr:MAG: hypothetical protein EU546_01915 [Candidatus Thorarchaeota archaeon]
MDARLRYDVRSYLQEEGNTTDKARLIAAGYDDSKETRSEVLSKIQSSMRRDGGIPFNYNPNAPSSVKGSAEFLTLTAGLKEFNEIHNRMSRFLVSRQKKDGGFAELLALDPYIEDKWGSSGGRDWYPVVKSLTWLTGKALRALVLAGHDDRQRHLRARDFLVYSQNEDGYWPDFKGQNISDPLATGNILEGLIAVGVPPDHKVYKDGRAALMQHLMRSLKNRSLFDMADLPAMGKPESKIESELIREGVQFIVDSQQQDGGWSPLGTKKSDPELSSKMAHVVKRCEEYV